MEEIDAQAPKNQNEGGAPNTNPDQTLLGGEPVGDGAGQQTSDDGQQPQPGDTGNEGSDGDGQEQQGAPEQYDFKAPEGRSFNPEVIGEFASVAKELNLSQDAAQKMIDKISPKLEQSQAKQIAAIRDGWKQSTITDEEIGGDKLAQNIGIAKAARDTFGTPALRDLLETTGLGNHPEIIRLFAKVGREMSEDTYSGGRPAGGDGKRSTAATLYDNTK
jgi:hypothetical protein